MQKLTQKWTVVVLLEQMDEGTEFFWKNWPQHITLVDVFAVDWATTNLLDRISSLLKNQKILEVVVADDTRFGPPENPVPVTLFEESKELQYVHNNVIKLLKEAGAVFNNPQYTEEGFIAHSTIQKNRRLNKDDVLKVRELTIIDMFPNGDGLRRRVFKTIKFSD